MGSAGVVQMIKGSDARKAFDTAYEQARYESGSGGYTGTIAESSGYFLVPGTYLEWEADQKAHQMLNTDAVRKWGPTGLLAVVDPDSPRTIELTVDVTGAKDYDAKNAAVQAAVKAKLRTGERIAGLKYVENEKKTKVVTTTTAGTMKTVYAVKGQQFIEYFSTMTKAKARAKEVLDSPRGWETQLKITKVTVRESGEPLVVLKKVTTKETVKVTATVGKVSTIAATKWIAVGWYSD
jgi:hypothetical protein